jgi:hypothetical protein
VLVIFALFQISFFVGWTMNSGLKYEQPKSPSFTKGKDKLGWLRRLRSIATKLRWWLSKDIVGRWGTRGEWIGASVWTIWLLYLCIANTGNGRTSDLGDERH